MLHLVGMNLKVLFTLQEVIKKSLLVRQDKLELIPATFEEKYWELDSAPIINKLFFLETLKH
jgi:hypothetical protein